MKTKKTYSSLKTLEKFGIAFAEVVLAGLTVYFTDRVEFLMLVPVIEAARNYLKHYKK
jgi:hypothetical protein